MKAEDVWPECCLRDRHEPIILQGDGRFPKWRDPENEACAHEPTEESDET